MLISLLILIHQYGAGAKEGISHEDLMIFAKVRVRERKREKAPDDCIEYILYRVFPRPYIYTTRIVVGFLIMSPGFRQVCRDSNTMRQNRNYKKFEKMAGIEWTRSFFILYLLESFCFPAGCRCCYYQRRYGHCGSHANYSRCYQGYQGACVYMCVTLDASFNKNRKYLLSVLLLYIHNHVGRRNNTLRDILSDRRSTIRWPLTSSAFYIQRALAGMAPLL